VKDSRQGNRCFSNRRILLVIIVASLAVAGSAISTAGGQVELSGRSFPPDTSPHSRPAIPQDAVLGRETPPAAPQVSGPPIKLSFPIDVNNVDFHDGSEPTIAINSEHPNLIVVHGGFSDWGLSGSSDASVFVSTDGGSTWDRRFPIDPPPGGTTAGSPNDTTISYGANSSLLGSFLGNSGAIYTGSTGDPYTVATFAWHTTGTPPVVQNTELIGTLCNDQPWVTVNSHIADVIVKGGQSQIIPIIRQQNDVYVAYDDFFGWSCNKPATPSVPLHVAVSPNGANPPNFTADNIDGATAEGPSVGINPGHRLAVAPITIMPDGTKVANLIYSAYQTCKDCSASPPLIGYMINRTRDRGGSWTLNGSSSGIEVDEAFSAQPTKMGGVNALLGGIDQLATDPGDGRVYLVYGVLDKASGNFGLAISRLFYNLTGNLTPGPRVFVTEDPTQPGANVHAALPAVAVAANHTVGVLWTNYEGTDLTTGFPAFTARIAVADGNAASLSFTEYTILRFLSPAKDNGNSSQRVWGDYQQMVALGNKFYGVFTGNGAALGRTTASSDPIFFTADVSVPTATPTASATGTATVTPTPKPSPTRTSTGTPVPTHTPTRTHTAIPTAKLTATPVHTPIPTRTPIATHTAVATHTVGPTSTPNPLLCVASTPLPTVPVPTPTPPPGHPVISSVSNPVQVGGSFTIKGSGFTAGSVVNFFVATSTGPVNAGPLKPQAGSTSTQLMVAVPPTVSEGQGFVSIEVVNTDMSFVQSNLGYALLQGSPAAGLPTITAINGHGLAASSLDPSFATANVETTLAPGAAVVLSGIGFDTTNGVAVDVFCACPGGKLTPTFVNPGDPGLKAGSVTFTLSSLAPPGPGSIVVSNAGSAHSYTQKSEAVSVPIGAQINVLSVSQSGGIVTVTGKGFSTLTVVNFFNSQSGKVVNLGGLKPDGKPVIPLTLIDSTKFTFTVPAGAVAGASFVQVLNPPFLPFTSSGNDPCGGFVLK
jgi:hypothetical protein